MLLSNRIEAIITKAMDRAYEAGKHASMADDTTDHALPWYLNGNRQNGMPPPETKKIIKEVFYDYREE